VKLLSEWFYRLTGWSIEGELPADPRYVLVGYPHTSNWDFFVFLAVVGHFKIDAKVLAHRGLFVWPIAWLLRRWGAVPVEGGARSVITTAVTVLTATDRACLVIAPEGTRAGGSVWKSGFWKIAEAADVPIVMGYVDRSSKRMGLGPSVRVDADPEAWMERARLFYADKTGLKPHNRGPVELSR